MYSWNGKMCIRDRSLDVFNIIYKDLYIKQKFQLYYFYKHKMIILNKCQNYHFLCIFNENIPFIIYNEVNFKMFGVEDLNYDNQSYESCRYIF